APPPRWCSAPRRPRRSRLHGPSPRRAASPPAAAARAGYGLLLWKRRNDGPWGLSTNARGDGKEPRVCGCSSARPEQRRGRVALDSTVGKVEDVIEDFALVAGHLRPGGGDAHELGSVLEDSEHFRALPAHDLDPHPFRPLAVAEGKLDGQMLMLQLPALEPRLDLPDHLLSLPAALLLDGRVGAREHRFVLRSPDPFRSLVPSLLGGFTEPELEQRVFRVTTIAPSFESIDVGLAPGAVEDLSGHSLPDPCVLE